MPTISARLADLAGGAFLQTASVTVAESHAYGFVRVELKADAFRRASWVPGSKLQLRVQRGTMKLRTYTPIRWDGDTTELLAYTHGDAPAANWFRAVRATDAAEVTGPRKSIDLRGLQRVVFVGDESSVALACALKTVTPQVKHVFEATDPDAVSEVLAAHDLDESSVKVAKLGDYRSLLARVREAVPDEPFDLVVTGNAKAVHEIRRDARNWPRRPGEIKGKAYWAEGRAGLD